MDNRLELLKTYVENNVGESYDICSGDGPVFKDLKQGYVCGYNIMNYECILLGFDEVAGWNEEIMTYPERYNILKKYKTYWNVPFKP